MKTSKKTRNSSKTIVQENIIYSNLKPSVISRLLFPRLFLQFQRSLTLFLCCSWSLSFVFPRFLFHSLVFFFVSSCIHSILAVNFTDTLPPHPFLSATPSLVHTRTHTRAYIVRDPCQYAWTYRPSC